MSNLPRQLLPISVYTSPEWYRRGLAELFGRVWAFGGMAEDLPAPGDYQVVQAGPHSLILLRDRDGGLAAFHNTCRHRGTRLLEGRGKVGRSITCFYHNWSYDLSGRLLGMAHEADQFPGLDKSCLGLHPAKVAQWRNLLFLHPDPAAEPLAAGRPAWPSPVVPSVRSPASSRRRRSSSASFSTTCRCDGVRIIS